MKMSGGALPDVSFLSTSDNLELDSEICDHKATREFKSMFMKISEIVPYLLENHSPIKMNFTRILMILRTKRLRMSSELT
ncbi:hypothetical protein ACTXT7_010085 [Hymenolepis weldensis]